LTKSALPAPLERAGSTPDFGSGEGLIMNAWGVIVIGVIAVSSGIFQFRVWGKMLDGEGRKTVFFPPFLAAGVVGCGAALYAIFRFVDPASDAHGQMLLMLGSLFGAAFFVLVVMAKSSAAFVVSGLVCAYSAYQYFEYGLFKILPVMEWIVGLLIHDASQGIVLAYTAVFVFGSVITNGIAAIADSPS
jgi:hypothetical protein